MALLLACGAPVPHDAPRTDPTSQQQATGDASRGSAPEQQAKGAKALVRDPTSPVWEPVADPERATTTTGSVVPTPARAPQDKGLGYERNCQVRPETTTVPEDACVVGDPDGRTEVVLVGDSKMLQWLPAVDRIARAEGWRVRVLTKSACGFTLRGQYDECVTYNQQVIRHLTGPGDVPDLVLTSLGDRSTPALGADLARNLATIESAGARIALVADNPAPDKGEPGPVLDCVRTHAEDWSSCSYPRNPGRGTAALEGAAARLHDARVIDVNAWICPTSSCPAAIGGVLAYRQGTHLTATYVRSLTPVLHRALIADGYASAAPVS